MVGRRSKWNTTFWSSALETWVSTKSPQGFKISIPHCHSLFNQHQQNLIWILFQASNISFQILTICCWTLRLVTRRLAQLGKRPWIIFSTSNMWRCVFPNFVPPWSFAECSVNSAASVPKRNSQYPSLSPVLHLGLLWPPFPLLIPFKCVGFSWYFNFVIIPQFLLLLFWNNSRDNFLFKAIHISVKHNSGPLLVKIFYLCCYISQVVLKPECHVYTSILMFFFTKIVMWKTDDLVKRSALRFDFNKARSKQGLCREFQDISRIISTSLNLL